MNGPIWLLDFTSELLDTAGSGSRVARQSVGLRYVSLIFQVGCPEFVTGAAQMDTVVGEPGIHPLPAIQEDGEQVDESNIQCLRDLAKKTVCMDDVVLFREMLKESRMLGIDWQDTLHEDLGIRTFGTYATKDPTKIIGNHLVGDILADVVDPDHDE